MADGHVAVSREVYAGLPPARSLGDFTVDVRTKQWRGAGQISWTTRGRYEPAQDIRTRRRPAGCAYARRDATGHRAPALRSL